VALNLCRDRIARRRETPVAEPPDVPDPRPSPARAREQREIGEHVSRALSALPPQQRAAITLCQYQGFRNIEAAEVLGVSVPALESLLARGRRTLRERLRAIVEER
jgi:RNA polymerase sigma-70 factor (ECF subfamily)